MQWMTNHRTIMIPATCCVLLLIALPCDMIMGRKVFTHRPLYDTACTNASIKTLSRHRMDQLHLCVHACVRREDCWFATYGIRPKTCRLLNGTCPRPRKYSKWVLWVFSKSERYIRDFFGCKSQQLIHTQVTFFLWTSIPPKVAMTFHNRHKC